MLACNVLLAASAAFVSANRLINFLVSFSRCIFLFCTGIFHAMTVSCAADRNSDSKISNTPGLSWWFISSTLPFGVENSTMLAYSAVFAASAGFVSSDRFINLSASFERCLLLFFTNVFPVMTAPLAADRRSSSVLYRRLTHTPCGSSPSSIPLDRAQAACGGKVDQGHLILPPRSTGVGASRRNKRDEELCSL